MLRRIAALAVVALVGVEIAFPGRDLYHTGWYNALIAAGAIVAAVRARPSFWVAAFGAAIVAFAGISNGLLAPDNRSIVGAPGSRFRVDDVGGWLNFPLVAAGTSIAGSPRVSLERPGRAPVEIGDAPRNIGSFVLDAFERSVVYVEARDARGGTLTITQPTGSTFLSPVLLMQQRQTIAGMDVPFDSFAVPAAHRIVKAVLFNAEQAAALHTVAAAGLPAVLFAVDDDQDRVLPHGIAVDPDGTTIALAGLRLHAVVLDYPAVDVVAVPQFAVTLAGAFLALAGTIGELVWLRSNAAKGNVAT
ncbi:MAG: hypothetical protein JO199_11220 [Candidatus Eremiobacteraeota bacterium]|nr:hypothetical protein [Candidatus Eremiobacteraeota bacterium]